MKPHPRTYSRMTREALAMMGGLIRALSKQRGSRFPDRLGPIEAMPCYVFVLVSVGLCLS